MENIKKMSLTSLLQEHKKFILPKNLKMVLNSLWEKGFEAYTVGGCVRDMLMEKSVDDYDVCTCALPQEVKKCFLDYKVIETGIKHGTVTVIVDEDKFEITTFRSESDYLDKRHPQKLKFETELKKDLSRRDFTMNAIAYSEKTGIVDLFDGKKDIENKVIKTVGDARERYSEDCLRLLRAVRFASVLGFEIDDKDAIKELSNTIKYASKERQSAELKKLIMGDFASKTIFENKELFFEIIPQLKDAFLCTQEIIFHKYNVLEHSLKSLEYCSKNMHLRVAMLLHDIGKPACKTMDENNCSHFKGHDKVGEKIAREILTNLRFSNDETKYICDLILEHNQAIPSTEIEILTLFRRLTKEKTLLLLEMIYCDTMGKSDVAKTQEKEKSIKALELAKKLEDKCYKISQLKINGEDLKKIGFYGEKIGKTLNLLLDLVIAEKTLNEHTELINVAKNYK